MLYPTLRNIRFQVLIRNEEMINDALVIGGVEKRQGFGLGCNPIIFTLRDMLSVPRRSTCG